MPAKGSCCCNVHVPVTRTATSWLVDIATGEIIDSRDGGGNRACQFIEVEGDAFELRGNNDSDTGTLTAWNSVGTQLYQDVSVASPPISQNHLSLSKASRFPKWINEGGGGDRLLMIGGDGADNAIYNADTATLYSRSAAAQAVLGFGLTYIDRWVVGAGIRRYDYDHTTLQSTWGPVAGNLTATSLSTYYIAISVAPRTVRVMDPVTQSEITNWTYTSGVNAILGCTDSLLYLTGSSGATLRQYSSTGSLNWERTSIPADEQALRVVDGYIFGSSSTYNVVRLSESDGSTLWTQNSATYPVSAGLVHIRPIVVGNYVIINAQESSVDADVTPRQPNTMCLDLDTGAIIWEKPIGGMGLFLPDYVSGGYETQIWTTGERTTFTE